MDYDSIEAAILAIRKAFKVFEDVFGEAFDKVSTIVYDVYESLKLVQYEEKIKFKPVLEIKPTKTYYRNKRISNYYCRNNC